MNAQIPPEPVPEPAAEPLDVIIVGAGISGIGMAAHLAEKCPRRRFVMLDRREAIGGTWDLFRYPGIRSDSDMYTLGFKFAPWREEESIASGNRILAYLARVVEERKLASRIRLGCHVQSANWDSKTALWNLAVQRTDGSSETVSGRFLYLGTGYYDHDEPHDPAIPGLANFAGEVIHPQFWTQGHDPSGKRIVVIGSGATAVTLVPSLAGTAAHVTMLQRTPSWLLSRPAKDDLANRLRKWLPERLAYALIRLRNVRMQDFLFKRSRSNPQGMGAFLTRELRKGLDEAWNKEDFVPPYGPWEQRLCLVPDGDLFKVLRDGSASVVTGQIERVEADGIRLTDGRHLPADVIVTATGLKLAVLGKIAISMDGVAVNFAERYQYRDCMFSNVPNMAALFGFLNAGWTLRVDIVAQWLCRLLNHMEKRHMDVATPVLPEEHALEEAHPFDPFSSGYLQRSRHLMPRSATTAPWRIQMDYLEDRRELARAPIDDGWMHFSRIGREALADGPALT